MLTRIVVLNLFRMKASFKKEKYIAAGVVAIFSNAKIKDGIKLHKTQLMSFFREQRIAQEDLNGKD